MMKKILSVFVVVICLLSACMPSVAAEDTTRYRLEINPENRYTDISDMDDYNRQIFANEIEETQNKQGNKIIYIAFLCVLLVIALVVLVVNLKKASEENEEEEKKEIKTSLNNSKKKEKASDNKKSSNGKNKNNSSKGKKK